MAIWNAGATRRWHTNTDLAHTVDRVDGHGARVAKIIIALHPDPSPELIKEALIHDDGEYVVGDIPAPIKAAWPTLSEILRGAEGATLDRFYGEREPLTPFEKKWLKFADRLDAYLWAKQHMEVLAEADRLS